MASSGPGRCFIDTWAWLVLANDRDPAFPAVRDLRTYAGSAPGAWVTTDYVLDETIARLFARVAFANARRFCEAIFESSQLGLVDIEHVTPERFRSAWRMRSKYRDKPAISFTDMTSFVVMRELGISRVVTGDAHFEHVGLGFQKLP